LGSGISDAPSTWFRPRRRGCGQGPGARGQGRLIWPLLLAYLHREEAATRWSRINADGSRVVIILRPARIAGREQVR